MTLAALLFVVTALGAYVLGRAAILGVARIGEAFLLDLRTRVFHHIMDLSMGFFDRTRTGLLVSRMTADVEALQDLVGQGLADLPREHLAHRVHDRRDVPAELAARARCTLTTLPIVIGGDGVVPARVRAARTCGCATASAARSPRCRRVSPGVRVIQAFDQTDRTVGDFTAHEPRAVPHQREGARRSRRST